MTPPHVALDHLSDDELLAEVKRLVGAERRATAPLVRSLAELDARRLYLGEGCASLFVYCTQVLHLAEGAAYNRIEAARAARRFPLVLEALEQGSVTLTAVRLLAPHLTEGNHRGVLIAAHHKSKREIEQFVASLNPKPAVPATIRRLPAGTTPTSALTPAHGASAHHRSGVASLEASAGLGVAAPTSPRLDCHPGAPASAAPPALPAPAVGAGASPVRSEVARRASQRDHAFAGQVVPLAPERYRLQLTISGETHEKLRRAQALLRHTSPSGDLATIVDRALTVLLDDLERRRFASTASPRPPCETKASSRRIPAAVRRAVWHRDDGRCAFVGTHGRCTERGFLEFHHVEPYAAGGSATVENLELRCRAHNGYEASLFFGRDTCGVVRRLPERGTARPAHE